MKPCPDCGGDVGRGWTCPSDHDRCAACDIARALGSPIPPRTTREPTYWMTYYQRKKLGLLKVMRDDVRRL